MKALLATSILIFAGVCAYSQQSMHVAMVDSGGFDKAGGIRRLHQATSVLYSDGPCTFSCYKLKEEIERLDKEIEDLNRTNEATGDRQKKHQQIKSELDRLESLDRANFKKLYGLLVEPVTSDIREMLKKFAVEKGFAVIIDQNSVLFDSSVLAVGEKMPDVTLDFVKFCNESFERKTNKQTGDHGKKIDTRR